MDYSQVGRQSTAAAFNRSSEGESGGDRGRPKSRRGNHGPFSRVDSLESELESKRNMRPTSAFRGETSSHLSSSSFGMSSPIPIARGGTTTNMQTSNVFDRPITQQGLSGMRMNTAVGRQRQSRDRRYWEEILNARIKSLKAEIGRLQKMADTAAREKSANKHYEARGRELAQELTDLQGRLSDYNIASQMVTASDIIAIQKQATELEVDNNKKAIELETIFAERQNKESQFKQIEEQINKEKNTIDLLINDMSQVEKAKYNQLKDVLSDMHKESEQMKTQIDELSQTKGDLEKQISISQMKMHMVDMLRKLTSIEAKRDSLKEELYNKLQPAQERDQLLIQVREDNAAISSMENSAQSIKEEIKRAEEQLEQAEQDLEEGQSERHQKYRELKKREETMDTFMAAFEKNVNEEKNRIANLESDIVFALEHISSNIEQLNFDEIDLLKQKNGSHTPRDLEGGKKGVDGLAKECERLEMQLKKTNSMREHLAAELGSLPEKIKALNSSIESMSNLDNLRSEGSNRKKQLLRDTENLQNKLTPTENAVKEAEKRYRELQKKLDGNEMYSQLNAMEERLAEIESGNANLREDIASITIKTDYEPLKIQVFDTIKTLNDKLKTVTKNPMY